MDNLTGYQFDEAVRNEGYSLLCGVDEAGRGPLAGAVFAAAVILDPQNHIAELNDSKKLSEKKRELLYDEIIEKALSYSVASASVEEIEEINILQATMLAMKRAVEGLNVKPDFVIVDGNKTPDFEGLASQFVIKGDALSASISAASILAKVSRDRYITELALSDSDKYSKYLFEKHKGYGTKVHRDLILLHGPCDIHRISFLKKILNSSK